MILTEILQNEQVVRIAKSKSTILPEEPGYGTESVRDEIYRIVDILDPIDRVKIRYVLPSNRIVLLYRLEHVSPQPNLVRCSHLCFTHTHTHTHTHTYTHTDMRAWHTHGHARVACTSTTSLAFCERTLIYLSP